MPDLRLAHRAGLLTVTPTGAAMSHDERFALLERCAEADTLADLSAADREVLRSAAFDVSDGRSTLDPVLNAGDWEAIDAAEDADDEEALERALDTVGRGQEVAAYGSAANLPPLGSGDAPADDTSNDDPEDLADVPELPEVAEGDWVGL